MISQNVSLVSSLHDPEGRITKLLELHGKKLINLYNRNAVIGITPATINRTTDLLKSLGFKIKIQQDEKTSLIKNYIFYLDKNKKVSEYKIIC